MTTAAKPSSRSRLPEIRARLFDRSRDAPSKIENLLTRKQQIAFRRIATVFEYRRGGITIFSEGEDAHFVYTVVEGIVRVSRHTDKGRRQVLALRLPGDVFGLPEAGIYLNTAEVACPATLYRIPWDELRGLMLREPALQLSFLTRVAYDFREAQRRIMILGQQNTYQRLASLLLDFAEHPAFFDSRNATLSLPLTRFDIADYLGTAPETVARGFARLEREGLVRRLSPRQTRIYSIDGLRRLQTRARRV
jgi:CRP/FNR family transcriptional regulator, anaerobic regulatory protein